jgi:hypothetical protein
MRCSHEVSEMSALLASLSVRMLYLRNYLTDFITFGGWKNVISVRVTPLLILQEAGIKIYEFVKNLA